MRAFVLILTFFLVGCIISAEEVLAQIDFTHVTNGPVLSYGAPGQWDFGSVWYPAVIKDGDTLRMWYTAFEGSVWQNPIGRIGYARSLDGVEWHRFAGNPVLSAVLPWEEGKLFECAVIKDGGTFKMWYGAAGIPSTIIGYATSADGRTWQKHPDPVLQRGPSSDWDNSIITPHTVIKEGNVYKMWFSGATSGFPFEASICQVGFATSADGINWVKYNDSLTPGPPYSASDPVLKVGIQSSDWDATRAWIPMVLPTSTGYEMWYSGLRPPITTDSDQWFGYARSVDGISWVKWPTNPVIGTNPVWGYCYYGGTVLKFNANYHLWFSCFHTPPTQARPQIGYAISSVATSVASDYSANNVPSRYHMFQNYPNPFNPETRIHFELPHDGPVRLVVYDLLGREVTTLIDEFKSAGRYDVRFNAVNLVSGVYFYRLQAGTFNQVRKLLVLR